MTNLPSTANQGLQTTVGARDDSGLPVPGARRTAAAPRPSQTSNGASTQPSLAPAAPIRAAPERYRRSALRADSTGAASGGQLRPSHSAMLNRPNSFVGSVSAVDDTGFAQSQPHGETKRVRRRSMPALDSPGFPIHLTPHDLKQPAESNRPKTADLDSKAGKTGNSQTTDKTSNDEQVGSSRGAGANVNPSSVSPKIPHFLSHSRNSGCALSNHTLCPAFCGSELTRVSLFPVQSANRNGSDPTGNPTMPTSLDQAGANQDSSRTVNVPPRSSSTDASNTKRAANNSSPLSKPVTMDTAGESGQSADATDAAAQEVVSSPRFESPAVRQLTAINEKRGRPKSKTSRLRRAFSFGSAAEFRKAADDSEENGAGKLHKDRSQDDAYDEEQARIAERQEAAGIGSNIYAGGRFFHGSTDNLSISSTASSASIMIRKMGRGMKKSTRSLVGLFRPKSIIGAPAVDALPETSQAAVSMITAEAERELVNVNADPKAQGGGTGFPRLERNSIDAAKVPTVEPERVGSSGTDSTGARKSIVGGEKERAEVLAAVRKGILKRTYW